MKGVHNDRASGPTGRRAPHAGLAESTATENWSDPMIHVQCPACGKEYTLRSRCAGKKGRCTCGTVFPLPNAAPLVDRPTPFPEPQRQKSARRNADEDSELSTPLFSEPLRQESARRVADDDDAKVLSPEEAASHKCEAEDMTEVRVGCIGRGHAGKTALLRVLGEGAVGDFFPSGLHVDAADPREVAQMIREAEEAQRLLHQFGLPPTLKAAQIRYCLYDGAEPRIVYRMREVIGQVITHTLPDSA